MFSINNNIWKACWWAGTGEKKRSAKTYSRLLISFNFVVTFGSRISEFYRVLDNALFVFILLFIQRSVEDKRKVIGTVFTYADTFFLLTVGVKCYCCT